MLKDRRDSQLHRKCMDSACCFLQVGKDTNYNKDWKVTTTHDGNWEITYLEDEDMTPSTEELNEIIDFQTKEILKLSDEIFHLKKVLKDNIDAI